MEFLAEVIYHDQMRIGLGARFAASVEEAAARALAYPGAGSPSSEGTRRVLLKGFRFSLVYRPESDGIVIVAVAHHARRPFYWKSRAGDQ